MATSKAKPLRLTGVIQSVISKSTIKGKHRNIVCGFAGKTFFDVA